jgi:hypothetical protein
LSDTGPLSVCATAKPASASTDTATTALATIRNLMDVSSLRKGLGPRRQGRGATLAQRRGGCQ